MCAYEIHFALRGDNGFDVVGFPQRIHLHIVIHTQQNVFQIGTGKPILGYFPDATVFHIRSEEAAEHRADLRFPLAAATLNDHHALTLVAGNQAVAEKFR